MRRNTLKTLSIILLLSGLATLFGCGEATTPAAPDTTNAASAASTRVPIRTRTRVGPTRTPRPSPTPTPRPADFDWRAIGGYQSIGFPLPVCIRTFGGGIFVPEANFSDIQSATFDDTLVLGIGAYLPNDCEDERQLPQPDGTGVQSVRFTITDPQGNVFDHTEQNVPYCIFQDTSGLCNPWSFSEHGCQWPAGSASAPFPVAEGFHDLQITLTGTDGTAETWGASLIIEFPDDWVCLTT